MTATLLDGKRLATEIQAEIKADVAKLRESRGIAPCLAAVLVGENAASEVYVRSKRKACESAGMESQLHRLPTTTTTAELVALVRKLNESAAVHGILVQLPLPPQVNATEVLDVVSPYKDVDGFHPENVGLLSQGRPRFVPCTPLGIQQLLVRNNIPIAGRQVVVLGRSDIVGKPMAMLLMRRGPGGDATVTVCHSRSRDLGEITRRADILIVAIGRARFVTAPMVKPGSVVIDVGMNRQIAAGEANDTPTGAPPRSVLCGDVDFEQVKEQAAMITPVPGGVGPLTVTMLLHNTLAAARS